MQAYVFCGYDDLRHVLCVYLCAGLAVFVIWYFIGLEHRNSEH